MREYGLIGYPLDHAFSKKFFENKFESENIQNIKYHLFPISEVQRLPKILESHPNLCGLNVTIPYKELVIPYLDDIDPVAISIGAVNTISIVKEDKQRVLKGFNTDIIGIEKMLDGYKLPDKALVFGTGGASKALRHFLKLQGVKCITVSRDPVYDDQIDYDEVNREIIRSHNLIVNCTPVGMYPKVKAKLDIPYEFITEKHICMDMIYNPVKTLFLEECEKMGAEIKNGFTMLEEQAEQAWKIWEENHFQLNPVKKSV